MNNVFKSSLQGINDMIFGYDREDMIALFGTWQSGKSLLVMQEAAFVAKQMKRKILVVDTEGGAAKMWRLWYPVLSKRFEYNYEYDILRVPPTLPTILELHGELKTIKPYPSGKLQCESRGTLTQYKDLYPKLFKEMASDGALYYQGETNYLEDKYLKDVTKSKDGYASSKYGILIYDSVTQLFGDIPATDKAFPARAAMMQSLLICIQNFAAKYGFLIFGLHHESKDPQNEKAKIKLPGGKSVGHNFKVVVRFRKCGYSRKEAQNIRELTLYRFPSKAPGEKVYLNLDNEGYKDLSDMELKVLTRGASEEENTDAKPTMPGMPE
jgi:hypothetical protein